MKVLRTILSFLLAALIALSAFYIFYMRPRHVVPILMYHGVDDVRESSLYVSPANFKRQMEFLHNNGYRVVSLDDLAEGIRKGASFDRRTVVITFDDGLEDNYLNAFPVLARYRMPATIFLITGYVGNREGYLNWDQVRLMMGNGMDFGGHTRNNVYLPSVKDGTRLLEEVAGPKEDIRKNAGREPGYFCYPTGGFNANVKEAVKKAGYKGACTTNRGSDRYNADVYELNRVKITNSDMTKPLHFRAKLSGYYNLFRSLKSPE